MPDRRPLVIAGPTASGKSALALAVAARDGGCVINADAFQVYACWRVLTARPDDADCARAPHRLYGHVPCDAGYSVGIWLREIAAAIGAAQARGERPIVVGGAGLYLDALTTGLADIPPVPAEVRARSEARLRGGGIAGLRDDLARLDPETLSLMDRNNPMRVQRAWEVVTATGRGLSDWRRQRPRPVLAAADADKVCLSIEKIDLNNRIERRIRLMVEQGALEECARFGSAGLAPDLPAGRALGAREFLAHLSGALTLEAAMAAAATATRRYAKRQRSWFRNRMADWPALDPLAPDALARIPR